MKILCIGDIHLGRSPSKTPPDTGSPTLYSPSEALHRTAELAIKQNVDIVAFTGDVVDSSNALFEAYSALSTTVKTLLEADIQVIAIAGNHDYEVLPRLAEELPNFKLLGADGAWESFKIQRGQYPAIRVLGISFTSKHSHENPLSGFPSFAEDDCPAIALMHCDVNASGSSYAPVSLDEIRATFPVAWLLGHIHKPTPYQHDPLILYPGSLQGLDPGETGPHGPWIITISDDGTVCSSQLKIAPLRYEEIPVNLSKANDINEAKGEVLKALQGWHNAHIEELEDTQAIGCRIILEGRSNIHNQTYKLAELLLEEPSLLIDQITFFIEKVVCASCPAVDFKRLSEQSDLPGLLAKRLVVLENREPQEDYEQLLQNAKKDLLPVHSDGNFNNLEQEQPLSNETIRSTLLQSGLMILSDLLAQKEVVP